MNAVVRGAAAGLLALIPIAVPAHSGFLYEVTVTNITAGQQFTPVLLVTHRPELRLFELGTPASAGLATLAEEGNVAPLKQALDGDPHVNMTVAGTGLTNPGATVRFMIQGHHFQHRISLAAMLIPTNDAFVALNGVALPSHGSVSYRAPAYDAGSERNAETCASIPGPNFTECDGAGGGGRIGGGEGFVHIHRGIHGIGNFAPADRAWLNPVARITIRRID